MTEVPLTATTYCLAFSKYPQNLVIYAVLFCLKMWYAVSTRRVQKWCSAWIER